MGAEQIAVRLFCAAFKLMIKTGLNVKTKNQERV